MTFAFVVFIVFVVIGAEPTLLRPPSKFRVDTLRVEGSVAGPDGGGYDWLLMVKTFILFVLIVLVLIALVLTN